LRIPAAKALRYGALLLSIPIPYLLLMQEHGLWAVAQVAINGFGLGLLGLLAFHHPRALCKPILNASRNRLPRLAQG